MHIRVYFQLTNANLIHSSDNHFFKSCYLYLWNNIYAPLSDYGIFAKEVILLLRKKYDEKKRGDAFRGRCIDPLSLGVGVSCTRSKSRSYTCRPNRCPSGTHVHPHFCGSKQWYCCNRYIRRRLLNSRFFESRYTFVNLLIFQIQSQGRN